MPQFLLHKWGIMNLAFVYEYLLELGLMSDSSQMSAQDHGTVWLQPLTMSESKVGLIQQKRFRG